MFDLSKIAGIVVAAIGLVFALSMVLAIPVWLLWNWLCPTIWGWPQLSLMQAWGMTVLCGFLFKSGSSKSKD